MTNREVKLALAAFLDSPQGRALVDRDARAIAELFLRACYEALGVRPRLLDGEALRTILGDVLPGEFRSKDGVHRNVPDVVAAYIDHLAETEAVTHLFELRIALEEATAAFHAAVESGTAPRRLTIPKQESVVHHADKLGRNDPCFCGSGKKFKKCHGT